MFYKFKERTMLFWCFLFTFQCFVLINFEIWQKRTHLEKLRHKVTSVDTRLQFLSKKLWAIIYKTSTNISELLSLLQ